MKYFVLFTIVITQWSIVFAQPPGFGFGKQIIIDAAQVSGPVPLVDFPVLISITDNDLRTVVNGGSIENSNGFDILFTLSDCSTVLAHDLEHYNPVTGELVAWVQVPSLDNAMNTFLFMYYGNSAIVADLSSPVVWTDVGYDGVWHFHNDFLDASGSANNGVNNGSSDLSPAFNFGDGQNFVDPNHWVELPNHPTRSGDFSYSAWVRTTNSGIAGQRVICDDQSNGNGCHALSIGDGGAGRIRFYIRGLNPVILDSPAGSIVNNTWHYVVGTFNGTTNLKSLYVDGVLVNSAVVTGTLGAAAGNASIGGEVATGESGNRLNGDLDEIRASNSVLSADWILTEYNNQNSPTSFYSFSPQLDANTLCLTLPVELISFRAFKTEDRKVRLEWITASEVNNDFFTIERSSDGIHWEELERISSGSHGASMNYEAMDNSPLMGLSYYRLKQTDFDGEFEYLDIETIQFERSGSLFLFPNPTYHELTVQGDQQELLSISIVNTLGQNCEDYVNIEFVNESKVRINTAALPSGVYILKSSSFTTKFLKK